MGNPGERWDGIDGHTGAGGAHWYNNRDSVYVRVSVCVSHRGADKRVYGECWTPTLPPAVDMAPRVSDRGPTSQTKELSAALNFRVPFIL